MGLHLRKDGTIDTSNFKIVYIAPMKALVAEMVGNFSTRLEPYGMKVRELTGDVNLTKAEIDDTQVRSGPARSRIQSAYSFICAQ